ncbi:type I methionyl aminopeptidase [Brumimicrobium aurantiacum]|uniref:Methionine aminopeptidase n=1 Tax=Brumimicrobium aurantiacum TaxID=1737063 RepID=A0A3E1EUN0_9FLAO|nr:type I methionyl aminopeptidase [Brumimicrobium aurantiacum]RFC53238.1 type I methionyl aminopeptidase [Brumimicrobium aurantiacum]
MIKYKSKEEIEKLRAAAQVVSRTLGKVAEAIEPGVTTLELDAIAEDYIRSQGAVPGFLGLYDFPNTLCISVNEQVVHGYPTDEPIKDGDVVSVDCGAILDGYYGDHAYTFAVGNVSEEVLKLLEVTKECLNIGIEQTRVGNRMGDIGYHIQKHAEDRGYGVVRELVGHGIGQTMHEEPQVPNYGRRGRGKKIKEGLTIAIEPMINLGTAQIKYLEDNWTIVTLDGKASAHFEHDVAVVDGKPDVLSTFKYVEEALAKKDNVS